MHSAGLNLHTKLYQAPEPYREINIPIWDTVANVADFVGKPISWVSNCYSYLAGRSSVPIPSSAPGHAFFGHYPELGWKYNWSLIDFITALQNKHGDKGLYTMQMGPFKTYYVVSDPKMAKEILNNSEAFPRGESLEIWREFSKEGLGKGEYAQEKRRQAIGAIGDPHHGYFFPSIKLAADRWIEHLEHSGMSGEPIDLMRLCKLGTLEAIGESLFKHNAHDPSEDNPFNLNPENIESNYEVIDSLDTIFSTLTNKFTSPFGSYRRLYNFFHPWEAKDFQKAIDTLEIRMDKEFHKLLDNPETLDRNSKFCSIMATLGVDIDKPNYVKMRNEVLGFLQAAFETSAKAMSWILYVLAFYPDLQEELYGQLHEAFRESPPQSRQDFAKVPLLRQVMEEALRLFPPFPFLLRDIVDASKFKPFQVKQNGKISSAAFLISPFLINRNSDPKYAWGKDAEEFKPERWTTPKKASVNEDRVCEGKQKDKVSEDAEDMLSDLWQRQHPECMTTFAGGKHVCPGRHFAKQEILLFLTTLIPKFKISLVPTDVPVQLKFCISLETENPIYVYLTPR